MKRTNRIEKHKCSKSQKVGAGYILAHHHKRAPVGANKHHKNALKKLHPGTNLKAVVIYVLHIRIRIDIFC